MAMAAGLFQQDANESRDTANRRSQTSDMKGCSRAGATWAIGPQGKSNGYGINPRGGSGACQRTLLSKAGSQAENWGHEETLDRAVQNETLFLYVLQLSLRTHNPTLKSAWQISPWKLQSCWPIKGCQIQHGFFTKFFLTQQPTSCWYYWKLSRSPSAQWCMLLQL